MPVSLLPIVTRNPCASGPRTAEIGARIVVNRHGAIFPAGSTQITRQVPRCAPGRADLFSKPAAGGRSMSPALAPRASSPERAYDREARESVSTSGASDQRTLRVDSTRIPVRRAEQPARVNLRPFCGGEFDPSTKPPGPSGPQFRQRTHGRESPGIAPVRGSAAPTGRSWEIPREPRRVQATNLVGGQFSTSPLEPLKPRPLSEKPMAALVGNALAAGLPHVTLPFRQAAFPHGIVNVPDEPDLIQPPPAVRGETPPAQRALGPDPRFQRGIVLPDAGIVHISKLLPAIDQLEELEQPAALPAGKTHAQFPQPPSLRSRQACQARPLRRQPDWEFGVEGVTSGHQHVTVLIVEPRQFLEPQVPSGVTQIWKVNGNWRGGCS